MSKRPTESNTNADVIEALSLAMAETAVAQMKAQTFHWNVTGMAFGPLHDLFAKVYQDHFAAIDDLAERVKALGGHADGRYATFLARSGIKESDARGSAKDMVAALAADQRHLSRTLLELAAVAEERDDMVTNDMAIGRAEIHDKFAWLLGAHLDG